MFLTPGGRQIVDKEQNFADILQHINQGVVKFDSARRLVVWNEQYERALRIPDGFLRAGIPNRDLAKLLAERGDFGPDFDDEKIEARLNMLWNSKDPRAEITILNDRTYDVQSQRTGDGGLVITYADITERKRAADDLRQREEQFKALAEMSSDWFWRTNEEHLFVGHSWKSDPAAVKRGGTEGLAQWDFASEKDLQITEKWDGFRKILNAHEKFRGFEFELNTDPAQWVRVSGDPMFDEKGRFLGYQGTSINITDQKQAEAEQTRHLAAFNAMTESVAIFDAEDRFVFCNHKFRDLNSFALHSLQAGFRFEEHLQIIAETGNVPDALGREAEWVEERMELHRNPRGPFELRRQNGTWVLINEQRLPDGGTITITTDVTEIKTAQERLAQALSEAERASQSKSEFLATMSHEFRTPLNAILGFSEMISTQFFGPIGVDNYREYANDIHNSGEHMLALVNDVLDISAIEAGRRDFDLSSIDMAGLVTRHIKEFEKAAADKNIQLAVDLPPSLPNIIADERSVVQVVLNLMSNAVKFTGNGGTVTISANQVGDDLDIIVTDTGIGIPGDRLAEITEPFTQATINPHNSQEGTGLGLSIVKSLVEAHGGRLHIESELDRGTEVKARFPLTAVERSSARSAAG